MMASTLSILITPIKEYKDIPLERVSHETFKISTFYETLFSKMSGKS